MLPSWTLSRPLVLRSDAPDHSRTWALGLTALYVVAAIAYGLLSNAPWDDDCVVRYFHCREAWSKPEHFFSVWNRPLFMVLFAPTAWLGREVMMVQMVLIGALSGWLLYRALYHMGWRDAQWVLPFFYFQAFYFGVSRNFLTEPLAVAVICIGLHALVHQRYVLFALMGGLLPLARLELAAILPVWGLILLVCGRWRSALWMALPVLALMVVGYFVKATDDPLWLVEDTFGKAGKNRYGHRDVWHYFHRSAYVVGPVAFYFLVIGLLERIARLRLDLFIFGQGAGILLLYVIFSWKLDMGNSAGFLRNLIPLAPFIAIIAYEGFVLWLGIPVTDAGATARNEPAIEQRNAKKKKRPVVAGSTPKSAPKPWWSLVRPHLFGLVAVTLLYIYFDKELTSHHKISGITDHTPVILASALALIGVVVLALQRHRPMARWLLTGSGVMVTLLALGFTLYTERPDAHLNHERKAITMVSEQYRTSYLREWPLYCNHRWFFWPKDLGYPDDRRYRALNKAALDTAEAHSVILWENHYSNRLSGDVQLNDLYKRRDMVELMHVVGRDHRTTIGLFQKVDTMQNDGVRMLDRFKKANADDPYVLYAEQLQLTRQGDHQGALAVAERMMQLDSTYAEAVIARAGSLSALGRHTEAIAGFERAFAMDTVLVGMHYSIGLCKFRMKDYAGAITSMEKYIAREKKQKEAYDVLGASYYYQKRFSEAVKSYSEYIKLDPKSPNGWLNRASVHLQSNNTDLALADYDVVLKRDPSNRQAMFNKATALVRKGRKAEGCEILQQMAAKGDPAAAQQLRGLCK